MSYDTTRASECMECEHIYSSELTNSTAAGDICDDCVSSLQKKVEACDCGGSIATPWNYCDDCQVKRDIIEEVTQ